MDTQITISIGALIGIIGAVYGFMLKFKRDIKEETEVAMNGKIKDAVTACKETFDEKVDKVHEEINKINMQMASVVTNLDWLVKERKNGKSVP